MNNQTNDPDEISKRLKPWIDAWNTRPVELELLTRAERAERELNQCAVERDMARREREKAEIKLHGDPSNGTKKQIDEYLRDHGYDPVAVGLRGKILADTIIKNIELVARAERAENNLEIAMTALHEIQNWADAYPLEVFPEPNFAEVKRLLEAGGISVGSVSASNMRHVINGVKNIILEALECVECEK